MEIKPASHFADNLSPRDLRTAIARESARSATSTLSSSIGRLPARLSRRCRKILKRLNWRSPALPSMRPMQHDCTADFTRFHTYSRAHAGLNTTLVSLHSGANDGPNRLRVPITE
jgi:hypothetical protein